MITMTLVSVLSLADRTPRKRHGHDRNQQQLMREESTNGVRTILVETANRFALNLVVQGDRKPSTASTANRLLAG
jgi:hypothetical protein